MHKGFTLIELMIVISIIGILAIISTQEYNNYIARAQVTEAINMLNGVKPIIAEYGANNERLPPNLAILSPLYPVIASNGRFVNAKYLLRMDVLTMTPSGNYGVVITFNTTNINSKLSNATIRFSTPVAGMTGSASAWTCSAYYTIPRDVLPPACRLSYTSPFVDAS